MKRCISLLLALVLSLSCAGCGNTGPEPVAVQIEYDSAVVSYLGPEGTYTQEACGVFFEKQGEYIPYTTVKEAVSALTEGESNYESYLKLTEKSGFAFRYLGSFDAL